MSAAKHVLRSGLALLCGSCCLAMAVSPAHSGTEKYASEFMKIGVGARALGMGGAFVALADDASAPFWNPAGVTRLESAEFLFAHSQQFGLANHDYFGFVQPLMGDSRSAVGLGLVRHSVDDITVTRDAFDDLNGNGEWDDGEPILTDEFRSANADEYGLLLSYGRNISDFWSIGGNVKMLRQDIIDNTSFGMGLDLGVLVRPSETLTVGARINDVTQTQVSWDTGYRESVAATFALGVSYVQPMPALKGAITAAGDFAHTRDGRESALQGGLEYWYDGLVAARVGSNEGDFTAGAGLRMHNVLGGLGVDYAFLSHDVFDDTHRVSASVRF